MNYTLLVPMIKQVHSLQSIEPRTSLFSLGSYGSPFSLGHLSWLCLIKGSWLYPISLDQFFYNIDININH